MLSASLDIPFRTHYLKISVIFQANELKKKNYNDIKLCRENDQIENPAMIFKNTFRKLRSTADIVFYAKDRMYSS